MKTKITLPIVAILLFVACNNTSKQTPTITEEYINESLQQEDEYINKGKEIAKTTFKVLGGNLKKALEEGGVENAIKYCNINASSLGDSLSTHYHAMIKRTSHKLRNENNAPSANEQTAIDNYLLQVSDGKELKPIVESLENGETIFYAPIKMKPLCILCHGIVGESISKEDDEIIKKYYPNDKATGFKEGDFRGIWSITFKK